MDRSLVLDKTQELDITAEELAASVKNIYIIKSICKNRGKGGMENIASPYLNFRDALFHYKKMYEASDERTFIEQRSSVNEHLNRGIKDFAIHLCGNYYIPILHIMLDECQEKSTHTWLRHIYHGLKNLVVDIRLGGQSLQRFDDQDIKWLERMIELITTFHDPLNTNGVLYDLFVQSREKHYTKRAQ